MASIRRTLSPANHSRPFPSPFSLSSSSPKLPPPSPTPRLSSFLRRLSSHKYARRWPQSWRRWLFRCLLFSLIGFFLGMTSFRRVDDEITARDFSFEVKPNLVHLKAEENDINVDVNVGVSFVEKRTKDRFNYEPKKLLIVITPTYNRALQAYYLNRLGQVLRLVDPPVLWIVVEIGGQSRETAEILRSLGVTYRHLVCDRNMTDVKDRGVYQRNVGLRHVEVHRLDGVVYFADDDNAYSLDLFERLRGISRFGTWPVAMLAQGKSRAILEGPVCNGSQVIGWHTNEKSKRLRRFHVDMSGFAFNSTILWDPKRWKRPFKNPIRQLDTVKEGFQETTFIQQLVKDESQMEGIPDGCQKIMNWHLHLEARGAEYPSGWLLQNKLDVILPLS